MARALAFSLVVTGMTAVTVGFVLAVAVVLSTRLGNVLVIG